MTPSRRPRRTLALAAVVGLALTGCGAGIDAQTNQRRGFGEGANVEASSQILIRNFYLAPPEQEEAVHPRGSDVRAYAVFVNQSDSDDRLVSASSPVASSVSLWAGGDGEVGVADHTEEFLAVVPPGEEPRPGGTAIRAVPEEGDDPASAQEAAAEPAAGGEAAGGAAAGGATAGAAAEGDGTRLEAFEIPIGGTLEALPGLGYLLLEDIRDEVYPGTTVPVTLEFERAGSVTFPAYVHVLGEPAERESVLEDEGSEDH